VNLLKYLFECKVLSNPSSKQPKLVDCFVKIKCRNFCSCFGIVKHSVNFQSKDLRLHTMGIEIFFVFLTS